MSECSEAYLEEQQTDHRRGRKRLQRRGRQAGCGAGEDARGWWQGWGTAQEQVAKLGALGQRQPELWKGQQRGQAFGELSSRG